ncbi:hypothetical protein H4R19_005024 [Coemansia spiralis]|nr:hypothetical protein H4R19_005024 [Coemansia spiralis]
MLTARACSTARAAAADVQMAQLKSLGELGTDSADASSVSALENEPQASSRAAAVGGCTCMNAAAPTSTPAGVPAVPVHSLSISEEAGSAAASEPAVSGSTAGLADSGCTTGRLRCTGDKTGFDTCLFGRWGVIRVCAQGTSCVDQGDGLIGCV